MLKVARSIIWLLIPLVVLGCKKEEEKKHALTIIPALEQLEEDFCLEKNLYLQNVDHYRDMDKFLTKECPCRNDPAEDAKECDLCMKIASAYFPYHEAMPLINCGSWCEKEWKEKVSQTNSPHLVQDQKGFIVLSFWSEDEYTCYYNIDRKCLRIDDSPHDMATYKFALDAKTLKPIETAQTKELRELCIEKKKQKNP